jgi:hypothetical protein
VSRAPINAAGIEAAPPTAISFQSGAADGRCPTSPATPTQTPTGQVRPDGARGRLADQPQQRRHPQRAEDQADEAAEQPDHQAGDHGRDP